MPPGAPTPVHPSAVCDWVFVGFAAFHAPAVINEAYKTITEDEEKMKYVHGVLEEAHEQSKQDVSVPCATGIIPAFGMHGVCLLHVLCWAGTGQATQCTWWRSPTCQHIVMPYHERSVAAWFDDAAILTFACSPACI